MDINQTKIDAFGLVTAQIGYAFDNVLLYAKGGAAVMSNTFRVIWTTGELGGESKHVLWGGALAAGSEYGFAPNWSIGFEYAHLFMRPAMVSFTEPAGGSTASARISTL